MANAYEGIVIHDASNVFEQPSKLTASPLLCCLDSFQSSQRCLGYSFEVLAELPNVISKPEKLDEGIAVGKR